MPPAAPPRAWPRPVLGSKGEPPANRVKTRQGRVMNPSRAAPSVGCGWVGSSGALKFHPIFCFRRVVQTYNPPHGVAREHSPLARVRNDAPYILRVEAHSQPVVGWVGGAACGGVWFHLVASVRHFCESVNQKKRPARRFCEKARFYWAKTMLKSGPPACREDFGEADGR